MTDFTPPIDDATPQQHPRQVAEAQRRELRDRYVWLCGVLLIAMMAMRLAGPLPTRADDDFARRLALVRQEVRERYVEPVDDERLEAAALAGMLMPLDEHTLFVRAQQQQDFIDDLSGNFVGIGVTIRENDAQEIEVVSPIESSPALRAGIEAGEVIEASGDVELRGLGTEEASRHVKGPEGSVATLRIRNLDGITRTVQVERARVDVPTLAGFSRDVGATWDWWADPELKIGYVRLRQFTPTSAAALESVVRNLVGQGMRGLVIDLRFDPGGALDQAIAMADLFLDQGTILSVRGRERREATFTAREPGTLAPFPLAILVNQDSASASEILAGALKDHGRAVIVGERSFGKGSVQEVVPIGTDGLLKVTTAYYYLPSGRLVHRKPESVEWGVDPHVLIEIDEDAERELIRAWSDRDTIRNGRATTRPSLNTDPQLEAAVKSVAAMLMSGSTRPVEAR